MLMYSLLNTQCWEAPSGLDLYIKNIKNIKFIFAHSSVLPRNKGGGERFLKLLLQHSVFLSQLLNLFQKSRVDHVLTDQ